jgi:hypothetical protein
MSVRSRIELEVQDADSFEEHVQIAGTEYPLHGTVDQRVIDLERAIRRYRELIFQLADEIDSLRNP